MTKIKNYPGLSEETCYEVTLNKICNSFDFKSFISAKHKLCPANLTIECFKAKDGLEGNPKYVFPIVIKEYGYDSSSNRGQAYSDMGDYQYGDKVSDEIKETVKDYFKTYEPELFEEMKYGLY